MSNKFMCQFGTSAAAAKLVTTQYLKSTDRVLVLGGSGGLGLFICQYAKNVIGVEYLAVTTTQSKLFKEELPGIVDYVIDYRKQNWWELTLNDIGGKPFDVIIDLVNGQYNWQVGGCSKTTKVMHEQPNRKDTTYIQMLSGIETEIDASYGYISMIPFICNMIGRKLYSKFNRNCPTYITPQGLNLQSGDLKSILDDIVVSQKVKVILDPNGPFTILNDESIRNAMKLQNSKHAHGKVVIEISKEE